jgi:glycosyltransferase involved in cell wall biosynthesis
VNVGVIVPGKRQLELLGVARELRRQGLNFEFDFVGHAEPRDPYAAAFLEQVKPLEKEGFARYTDRIPAPELIKLLDSSSALVHFPPEESFGLVVAEALARNLRVFAARVGGLADIAEDVPGAELFDLDDWPALTTALANWIRGGGSHPPGAAAIMHSRYHPDVIARRHLEIYREVIG